MSKKSMQKLVSPSEHAKSLLGLYPTVAATPRKQESNMKNIASALVKAQKAFGPALKTNTNPHFRSKYADLSACVEAVIDSLNSNGIALIQQTHECENGVIVETVFVHESGETLSSGKLHVPASKHDAQGYGSALTYARRYSLMAACGIAPEDDDGNAASKGRPSYRSTPTQGAVDEVEDPDRVLYLTTLASSLTALVDKGKVAEAYERLLKEAFHDTDYMALWEILRQSGKTYVRTKIKAHKDAIKKSTTTEEVTA